MNQNRIPNPETGRVQPRAFLLMALMIAGVGVAARGSSLDSLVMKYSSAGGTDLAGKARTGTGAEKAVALFFLAARDTSVDPAPARVALESLVKADSAPLGMALLGASESMCARASRGNRLESAKWIGKALKELDGAVAAAPADPMTRILRIQALAKVPETFHVAGRLREDAALLEGRLPPDPKAGNPGVLTALAAADEALGEKAKAQIYRQALAEKTSAQGAPQARAGGETGRREP